MSKAHDPHWRYVALRIDAPRPVGRRALQNALLGRARKEGVADDAAPQLTRFVWPHAIVRVHHHALAAARMWLPRVAFAVDGEEKVPLHVQTLSSSGTIKTLTDRLGILERRAEDRPKGASGRRTGPSGPPAGRNDAGARPPDPRPDPAARDARAQRAAARDAGASAARGEGAGRATDGRATGGRATGAVAPPRRRK